MPVFPVTTSINILWMDGWDGQTQILSSYPNPISYKTQLKFTYYIKASLETQITMTPTSLNS